MVHSFIHVPKDTVHTEGGQLATDRLYESTCKVLCIAVGIISAGETTHCTQSGARTFIHRHSIIEGTLGQIHPSVISPSHLHFDKNS